MAKAAKEPKAPKPLQREKFKPFRAALPDGEYNDIQFPCYGSPKVDGIRGLTSMPNNGFSTLVSKTLKPIPNEFIRDTLQRFEYLDGELTVDGHHDLHAYDRAKSQVMTIKGEPNFTYWVFETTYSPDTTKSQRLAMLNGLIGAHPRVKVIPHFLLRDRQDFDDMLINALEAGFEGIMTTKPEAAYKWGQATVKENTFFKAKPYADEEATVVGAVEAMQNCNPPYFDATGRQVRSNHQDGMRPLGTLGSLVARSPSFSETFQVGTGLNDAQKAEIWANPGKYMNATFTYKYQLLGSTPERPRQPVFMHWPPEGT